MKPIEQKSKLLQVQHKIEFYDWFQNNMSTSLNFLLNVLMEIEWVNSGGIYILDQKSKDLVLVNHIGISERFVKQNKRFSQDTRLAKLILNKKFLFDNYDKLRKSKNKNQNLENLKAVAILPIFHNDKILGAILIGSTTTENISHSDQIGLEIIASKISTIISYHNTLDELKETNIHLDRRVQKRTLELEKVNKKLKQEITTHKKTQDALSYSENLYHSIFNNANDGIVLYDIKTLRPVDINPKAHEDLGYSKQEFLNLTTTDYTIYESAAYRSQVIEQLFKENHVEYHVKHITKSGHILYRTINANIVTINNHEYILGITHDITELKEKEIELQKSRQQLSELYSNIPIGLFMSNLKGEVLYANEALIKMLGYKSENELLENPAAEFYQDENKREEIIKILKDKGFVRGLEVSVFRKDRTIIWGLLSLKLVTEKESGLTRLDGVFEDISERKQAQLNLEKANRKIQLTNQNLTKKIKDALKEQENQQQYIIQKSKLESLGELAAGIAHEINQPLGIMSLIFENLQSKFNSGQVTKDYLDVKISSILKNIERIEEIINHIRIFSRERDTIALDKLDPNRVIHNVNNLIKTQYQNHNILIVYDLKDNPGFTVGSKFKFEQVILNLFSNAKYALEENEINQDEKYTKTIKITTTTIKNRICIIFEDNGIGIESENLNKLFDPFYTTKPEWVGTGLGLSIVYGIIKEMHGDIEVQSEPKKYTRFKILLPRFPEKV